MIERILLLVLDGTVQDPAISDAIAGDLVEEYNDLVASYGRVSAILWLSRQVALSFPRFPSLGRGRRSASFDARKALAFYGVMGALILLGVALVALLQRLLAPGTVYL